ncbi:MAG TPA: hypothetical protein VGH56_04610 [Solirubrobacteraceae bacterium]
MPVAEDARVGYRPDEEGRSRGNRRQVPPAWQKLANRLSDDGGRLLAIAMGLDGKPDAETKGMLLLNKAFVLRSPW